MKSLQQAVELNYSCKLSFYKASLTFLTCSNFLAKSLAWPAGMTKQPRNIATAAACNTRKKKVTLWLQPFVQMRLPHESAKHLSASSQTPQFSNTRETLTCQLYCEAHILHPVLCCKSVPAKDGPMFSWECNDRAFDFRWAQHANALVHMQMAHIFTSYTHTLTKHEWDSRCSQ